MFRVLGRYPQRRIKGGITMKKHTILLAGALLAGTALSAFAASHSGNKQIATVVKIAGIQWFNRMEEGVKKFAEESGNNAYQVGPAQADPQQQAALIEDMIAQGVDALAVVPMSPEALEPVLKRAMDSGITVITHEPRRKRIPITTLKPSSTKTSAPISWSSLRSAWAARVSMPFLSVR